MALKSRVWPGEAFSQAPLTVSTGWNWLLRFTVNMRSWSSLLCRQSAMAPSTGWALKPFICISMLLWPLHTHTSPMSTSFRVVVSPSLRVMV